MKGVFFNIVNLPMPSNARFGLSLLRKFRPGPGFSLMIIKSESMNRNKMNNINNENKKRPGWSSCVERNKPNLGQSLMRENHTMTIGLNNKI